MPKKNTAFYCSAELISKTDGSPVETGTTTVYVRQDNGSQATSTNSATHKGNGEWEVLLTAAEMNGNVVNAVFVNSSAVNTKLLIETTTNTTADLATTLVDVLADTGTDIPAAIAALNDISAEDVRTEIDSNSTQLALILADTGTDIPALIAALNDLSTSDLTTALGDITTAVETDIPAQITALDSVTPEAVVTAMEESGTKLSLIKIDTTAILEDTATTIPDLFDDIPSLSDFTAGVVTVVSPVTSTGLVELEEGDDYHADESRALNFIQPEGAWPDLTGASIVLRAAKGPARISKAGSVVQATGAGQKVRVELTAADIGNTTGKEWAYKVAATLSNGRTVTLKRGRLDVVADIPAP
ncbi:hypothetical protein Pla110_44250 [Polystyrenella longa]|uniref:Uncharacterized protein n=1 Tax=Polystyrenella longa TaxID=2528007 RepID=A0A518CU02_9PLAN|nr:hypothetical protein [Polystyrenella longa]QDU82664.1 hypothetical protein Pla110_44250 [Polystyrenella longa]